MESLPNDGVLLKWTNYVSGWQERYFEIQKGNLKYFKSKADKSQGCRGSVCLKGLHVTLHEYDVCEFTLSYGDTVTWHLKVKTPEDKEKWISAFTRDADDSDYSSTSTKSHSRNPSSASSLVIGRDSPEDYDKVILHRLAELGGYRTMCNEQMTSLQRLLETELSNAVDKPTILSIKAIHLAIINNIDNVLATLSQMKMNVPELDHPVALSPTITKQDELNYESEVTMKSCCSGDSSTLDPTSETEEEWHDADGDVAEVPPLTPTTTTPLEVPATTAPKPPRNLPFGHYDEITTPSDHPLHQDLHEFSLEQLRSALAGVEENFWTLFAQDGAMKMYTREVQDEGGLPVDPLKAVHEVKGVTALEFMHHFFHPDFKKDWDHTLNDMSVVEKISQDSVIVHQKHKTVWPAAPRESLFVSHIRRVDEMKTPEAYDLYIVCNKDIQRDDVPLGSSSSVRVGLTVSMVCQTVILNNKKPHEASRDDLLCKIIYVSRVHPGGWVPVTALRHVYKKEYPKFLRTFTDYVLKKINGKPIAI